MKTLVAILFLVVSSAFARAVDAPNPADYTMKVHISASRLKTECVQRICRNLLYADSILNGKKLRLSGNAVQIKMTLMLIAPGDYAAKLIKDVRNSDGSLLNQEYDLLLPDKIVWQCFTVGISE